MPSFSTTFIEIALHSRSRTLQSLHSIQRYDVTLLSVYHLLESRGYPEMAGKMVGGLEVGWFRSHSWLGWFVLTMFRLRSLWRWSSLAIFCVWCLVNVPSFSAIWQTWFFNHFDPGFEVRISISPRCACAHRHVFMSSLVCHHLYSSFALELWVGSCFHTLAASIIYIIYIHDYSKCWLKSPIG